MGQKMSRGEVQDLLIKFAAENPQYRQELLRNPKGLIERQFNTSLGSINVKAVADTADTVHVAVPYVASGGELADTDLEKVAGGKGIAEGAGAHHNINAECGMRGGVAVAGNTGNTVTNVKL
jgi:hypothetical protein